MKKMGVIAKIIIPASDMAWVVLHFSNQNIDHINFQSKRFIFPDGLLGVDMFVFISRWASIEMFQCAAIYMKHMNYIWQKRRGERGMKERAREQKRVGAKRRRWNMIIHWYSLRWEFRTHTYISKFGRLRERVYKCVRACVWNRLTSFTFQYV